MDIPYQSQQFSEQNYAFTCPHWIQLQSTLQELQQWKDFANTLLM
jgi:hypothetical protein